MIAENVAFGIIAAAMALGAIGVVRTKNVVHAALYLVVVLAGGAAQFILLGQEFVAWVQVLVYIGAVIVLFLFGIMLTRAPMHPKDSLDNDLRWPAAVTSVAGVKPLPGVPSRSRPEGAVRTPTTAAPSTSRLSAGKPVKMFTPAASARSPIHRTSSHSDAM